MAGALLNIILSFLGIDFLWPALDWTGKLFINMMQWMSGWNPLMHFSMPTLGSLGLMMMAILFSIAIVFRWPPGRKIAWGLAIITLFTLACNRTKQWSTSNLVIYHSPAGLLIDIYEKYGLNAIAQVDLLERIHHNQPLEALSKMSFAIIEAVFRRLE
jgi:hypothetical protein